VFLLLFTLKVQTTGQHVQPAPLVNQESASTAVDLEETPESVAAMRQRLRELENTVSTMRKQLAGTEGLASDAVGAQPSPHAEVSWAAAKGMVMEETTGSKISTETAVRVEDQQPRGFGDIMQDLAVELADLGTDLVLELGALAVLGTLCFLTSKAKINVHTFHVPTCTGKNKVAGKGPLGAVDKGCGRWFSANTASCDNPCAQVYTRETLLKRRISELLDGCDVGNQGALTTAHVDMDHANTTAWPPVKSQRNTFRLSCAAQPSLRPSWVSKQSVPFKPLTQCLLQCLEDADSLKDEEPSNSDGRSANLRTTAPCVEGEHVEKIMNEDISDLVPADSCCPREQKHEEDGSRETAQPLLWPKHVCKDKKNDAEECSHVVREGPELHIPSVKHEQAQEVFDQQHEGHGRPLEEEAVASEASSTAVAVEEVEEIEMAHSRALDRAETVEVEDREARETMGEGGLAEQQQQSDVLESTESPNMLENRDVAVVEKKEVAADGDKQLSGACDHARSAAGWLVAVSSWFTGLWPTPPAEGNSSTGLHDIPRPVTECSNDKTEKATSVNRTSSRAGKMASSRTPMSTKDTGNDFDFDEFEDNGCSSLTCGHRLLRVLVNSASACHERWSCKVQRPEDQGAQGPRRGEKMGRKRGRQQPRTTSQKQHAAKSPSVSKPVCPAWKCPCGAPLTASMSLMLTVCILGRLNLDTVAWSPLLARDDVAVVGASALTGAAKTAAAAQQEAIERLEFLKAEKGRLTLQHALLELESFQTEATDLMAKHHGIPEASKMEGFVRDAKALHGALQELTGAEFPQVEDSYMQVFSRWKSTLASAKARLAGSGSCMA